MAAHLLTTVAVVGQGVIELLWALAEAVHLLNLLSVSILELLTQLRLALAGQVEAEIMVQTQYFLLSHQ